MAGNDIPLPPPRPPDLGGAGAGAQQQIGGATNTTQVTPQTTDKPDPKANLTTIGMVRELLNGKGLGIPGGFTALHDTLTSATALTGQLTNIVNTVNASILLKNYISSNLPGMALLVGAGVVSAGAQALGVDPNNVIGSALSRAQSIFKDPISFLQTASRAQQHAEASEVVSAMNDFLNFTDSVGMLILGAKTLTDLTTGGITAHIGPGATNTTSGQRIANTGFDISASDIRLALQQVALALRSFGTLWDPNSPETIGTAHGLITSLRQQNIDQTIKLNQKLRDGGIDLTVDLSIYPDIDLIPSLELVTGADLEYVLSRTGITIYRPQNVKTLADLLIPVNILPQSALDHIPGASLPGFGRAIANFGIANTTTWLIIADLLDNLDIPDCPDINKVNLPSDYANLSPYLTSGSGLFGQALVKDFVGTAAGHVHIDAMQKISDASATVLNSPEGKLLKQALDDYDSLAPWPANEASYSPLQQAAFSNLQLALQAVANSSTPAVQQAIATSNQSTLDMALHMVAEIENYTIVAESALGFLDQILAAVDAISATISAGGLTEKVSNAFAMSSFGQAIVKIEKGDLLGGIKSAFQAATTIIRSVAQYTGMAELINQMTTNDAAGQRIRAGIADARNRQRLAAAGISTATLGQPNMNGWVDIKAARAGAGLTAEQIRIIGTDAFLRGLSVQDMIALNSLYGYNKIYYDSLLIG
jgi:hypothetical protein